MDKWNSRKERKDFQSLQSYCIDVQFYVSVNTVTLTVLLYFSEPSTDSIYIKPVGYKTKGFIEIVSEGTSEGHIQRVDTLMTYLRTKFHVSRSSGSILTIMERKTEENVSAINIFVILHSTK